MRKLMFSVAVIALLAGCKGTMTGNSADNAAADAGDSAYRVERVSLPGEGRGDYVTVDADGRRLYVTHTTQVHILDLDTLKPLSAVTGLDGAHGVALDTAAGHGFISDGNSNSVKVFDLATGKILKSIPVGTKPDSILRDPASGNIFVFNGDSEDVSVIDPAKGAVVATIKLPNGPEFSQADGKGKVWANMEEGNDIAEIDTKTNKLIRTIALTGCDGPAPLAFDPINRRLFSGCGNKTMVVTDADTGKVVASVPVGGDPDGIVFDADKKRIFVANRDKTWTIITQTGADSYSVAETLSIDEYAKTVGLDPKTHRVFSSTADLEWPPKPTDGKKWLPNAKSGTFRLMVVSEK
ncbi:YncE family protein [Sphingomonas bacterium]|uniref:YncE family protein n=1 Tax=Sphingomonas bacterium TaxID=1895847 RepID=UPI00261D72A7|nr:YncE family protein [Sphingomonas bacterium]